MQKRSGPARTHRKNNSKVFCCQLQQCPKGREICKAASSNKKRSRRHPADAAVPRFRQSFIRVWSSRALASSLSLSGAFLAMKARRERHTFSFVPTCSHLFPMPVTHLHVSSPWYLLYLAYWISDALDLLVRVPIWSYTFLGTTFFNRQSHFVCLVRWIHEPWRAYCLFNRSENVIASFTVFLFVKC